MKAEGNKKIHPTLIWVAALGARNIQLAAGYTFGVYSGNGKRTRNSRRLAERTIINDVTIRMCIALFVGITEIHMRWWGKEWRPRPYSIHTRSMGCTKHGRRRGKGEKDYSQALSRFTMTSPKRSTIQNSKWSYRNEKWTIKRVNKHMKSQLIRQFKMGYNNKRYNKGVQYQRE